MMHMPEWLSARIVFSTLYVITWLLITHILFHKKNPVSALAWVWAILLFPLAGAVFYVAFGTNRVSRMAIRRKRVARVSGRKEVEPSLRAGLWAPGVENISPEAARQIRMLEKMTVKPACYANDVELFSDAPAFYDELLKEIDGAREYIHVEFYIWNDDEAGRLFREALVRAAKRGAKVRLLVDEIGSAHVKDKFFSPLLEAGGQFSWFLSLHFVRTRFFINLRNHRKLVIIDGRVAYTGGMNIGDEYLGKNVKLGYWHDLMLRLKGPCICQLQEVFADDWYFSTGEKLVDPAYYKPVRDEGGMLVQVIEDGPDSELDPLHMTCLDLIAQAEERVWIETPYFIPYWDLIMQLQMAALKGLDVRLILSARLDHNYLRYISRFYYKDLLSTGVKIYEYQKGILHSKLMLVDGRWTFAGSANMDIRSFRLNFELNVAVHDPGLAGKVEKLMLSDLADSQVVDAKVFEMRPWTERAAESVLRLMAPAV
jgi:cardiolipin synthase